MIWQVKLLIKLAAAKASGEGHGSQVLSDLIGELKEADITTELRFKIDQSHPDIGAGYLSQPCIFQNRVFLFGFFLLTLLTSCFSDIHDWLGVEENFFLKPCISHPVIMFQSHVETK